MHTELELARIAVELGATYTGGPLTDAERQLVDSASSPRAPTTGSLSLIAAEIQLGADPLGEMFHQIREHGVRRDLGAFYTPPEIVRPMVEWLLGQNVSHVVDAGCGSGRFAAATFRAAPAVDLVAVDVDPLATLLTRATLSVLGASRVRVMQGDYMTLCREALSDGNAPVGFIGNPPYVRHHRLGLEAKERARRLAHQLGISFSALAGLHVYFYLATAGYARPGDAGCFVTSSEWLDVGYGKALRQLLLERLGLQALLTIEPQAAPFDGVMTTASIACFKPGTSNESIRMGSIADFGHVAALDEGRQIPRSGISATARWSQLLTDSPVKPNGHDTVPLGAVFRVHRGVATGSNRFFVLTRDQARLFGVERWCRPSVTSAREVLESCGMLRDNPARKLLLTIPNDIDRTAHPELDAYLHDGEVQMNGKPPPAHTYLATHRRPWWYLGRLAPPPIIVSYMARQAPHFALNPDGLVPINVAHGLYPREPLTGAQLASVVAYLNEHRESLRGSGRTYQGGLEKFEPSEVEAIAMPPLQAPG